MFVGITNEPRHYAWGSRTAIAGLLGRAASGDPEAELWLGTHPGSPAVITAPQSFGGAHTLDQLTTLPFLLKVLAASAPLSLQAHPTIEQARAGFDRENAAGIPLDSPLRNYKDAGHKPELIYALSDEYHALCGFRPVREAKAAIESLGDDDLVDDFLRRLGSDDSLPGVFEWLSSRAEGVAELVERVVALAAGRPEPEFSTVGVLAREYPGDPAIVISLLVNHVVLRKGQVLYLPAGNIHAYLEGVGIELMSSSDNVLRGGITPKHVDVEELLRVLDFATGLIPLLAPTEPMPGLRIFRPDVPDFALAVIELDRSSGVGLDPRGPAVALCVAGGFALAGRAGSAAIAKGEALYVSGDEGELRIEGSGLLFVAMGNPPAK